MGRWHADAAVRTGARVVAVVDPDPQRAERLRARVRASRSSSTLDDVLADVDAVHICTPGPTHVPLAVAALDAGRHVLVEKPLAPTDDEAAMLLELAARRNRWICPVHQFPFQTGVRRALDLLPTIAPIRHVLFRVCSAGAVDREPAEVALEILPHPLSLLARLTRSIEEIDWTVRQSLPGEVHALGQVDEMSIGLLVSMSGRPTINVLELIGAGGTAVIDLFHGFSIICDGRVSRRRKIAQPFLVAGRTAAAAAVNLAARSLRREPAYPGLRPLVVAFHAAVRGEAPCPIPAPESLAIARVSRQLQQLLDR